MKELAEVQPPVEFPGRTWVISPRDWRESGCSECHVPASHRLLLEPSSKTALCVVCAWRRAVAADPTVPVPASIAALF